MWRVSVAEKLADSMALGPKFSHAWQVHAVWHNDDSAMNSVPISYICACACASGVPGDRLAATGLLGSCFANHPFHGSEL